MPGRAVRAGSPWELMTLANVIRAMLLLTFLGLCAILYLFHHPIDDGTSIVLESERMRSVIRADANSQRQRCKAKYDTIEGDLLLESMQVR